VRTFDSIDHIEPPARLSSPAACTRSRKAHGANGSSGSPFHFGTSYSFAPDSVRPATTMSQRVQRISSAIDVAFFVPVHPAQSIGSTVP
jgi:hypothetical protein